MGIFENLGNTKLNKIPFGKDRPRGGSSGQPYITSPLFKTSDEYNRGIDLVRGGILGRTQAIILDTARHLKFLSDSPRGFGFITKQIGLQLCNPKMETLAINPIRGNDPVVNILNRGIDFANRNAIGPTRIYNGGINFLAQIGVSGLGGHIDRHGLSPRRDERSTYEYVANYNNQNNNNRLLNLKTKFKLGDGSPDDYNQFISRRRLKTIGAIANYINKSDIKLDFLQANTDSVIDSYVGGPNSAYGLGFTTIKRYYFTEDKIKIKHAFDLAKQNTTSIQINRDYMTPISDMMVKAGLKVRNVEYDNSLVEVDRDGNKDYKKLFDKISKLNKIKTSHYEGATIINQSTGTYKYKFSTSTPEEIILNKDSPIFNHTGNWGKINKFDRKYDAVIISFGLINPFTGVKMNTINFPAYFNSSLNFDSASNWNEVQYLGRSESFYTFNSYTRALNFSFDVPCFNPIELREHHLALGTLESSLAGMYNSNGILGGIIHKLNLANYVKNEPGILMNMAYTVPQEISWDIDEGLAHMISVNISFKFIHDQLNTYNSGGGFLNHIPHGNSKTKDPSAKPNPKPKIVPKPKLPTVNPNIKMNDPKTSGSNVGDHLYKWPDPKKPNAKIKR